MQMQFQLEQVITLLATQHKLLLRILKLLLERKRLLRFFTGLVQKTLLNALGSNTSMTANNVIPIRSICVESVQSAVLQFNF
jgi:hypothetical protein